MEGDSTSIDQVIISNENGICIKYDPETHEKVECEKSKFHNNKILSIATSHDGTMLLTSDEKGFLALHNANNFEVIQDFGQVHTNDDHLNAIESMIFGKADRYFYIGGTKGLLKQFSVVEGNRKLILDYTGTNRSASIVS